MQDKIEQLSKIKKMLDDGTINETEFNSLKKEILDEIKSKDSLSIEQTSGNDTITQPEKNKRHGDLANNESQNNVHGNAYPSNFKKTSKGEKSFLFIILSIGTILIVGYLIFNLIPKKSAAKESAIKNTDGMQTDSAKEINTENTVVPYLKKNGKYVLVDSATMKPKNGKEFDMITLVSEGLALVILNNKYGFIDKTGKIIIPMKYVDAFKFSGGVARVEFNNKWGFVNNTGQEVIPVKYDDAFDFSEGLALVSLNNKYGFIDKTGKIIIPMKYDYAFNFSEGLARVELNKKWGFVNDTDQEIIPIRYDEASDFSEGLASVEFNNKYGFIDKAGKIIVPFKYFYVGAFHNGFAQLGSLGIGIDGTSDLKYGFIDRIGREVVAPQYTSEYDFDEGLATVALDGNYGLIDTTGKVIVALKYDMSGNGAGGDIIKFNNGFAWVKLGYDVDVSGKQFFIDKAGREYREQNNVKKKKTRLRTQPE